MLRTSSWPADWLTDRASGWLSLVVGSLVSWAIVPIIILPLAGDKKVLFTLFHLLHSGPYKSMSATKHSLWKRISNGKFDFFFFFCLFSHLTSLRIWREQTTMPSSPDGDFQESLCGDGGLGQREHIWAALLVTPPKSSTRRKEIDRKLGIYIEGLISE